MAGRSIATALAVVGAVVVTCAQTGPRTPPAQSPEATSQRRTPVSAAQAPPRPVRALVPAAPSAIGDDEQRAFLGQYCASCHSDRAKAAGMDSARKLSMDALDPANVARDARAWELVVRKLRA